MQSGFDVGKKAKTFLIKNKQNADYNQYWYSSQTIQFLAEQCKMGKKVCFLSSPSVFYAMEKATEPYDSESGYPHYVLFDFDEKFGKNNPNYYKYDFNKPQDIPKMYTNYFDFLLADPPFITHEVWDLFAQAIKLVGAKDAKLLLSTIEQNSEFLSEQLQVRKKIFKPSIPNLVYQYVLYSNYEDQRLNAPNPELKQ